MTNPDYVLEFMRDNDMRFYSISNSFDREVIKDFKDKSLDEAINKLHRYFKNNVGFNRVKLFTSNDMKRDGSPVEKPTIFELNITGEEFKDKKEGIEGVDRVHSVVHPSPSGAVVGVDQYLHKHNELSELKADKIRLELEIKYLQEKFEKEIELLKKEYEQKLKEAQDSNAMFGQGISMLMSRMGVGE